MTIYKISNINGRFEHVIGKAAAIARANEIERTAGLSEADLVRDYGWTIKPISRAAARSVGLDAS